MKRANFPHRREARRAQAQERNAHWAALPIERKIEVLRKERPGRCARQLRRLTNERA